MFKSGEKETQRSKAVYIVLQYSHKSQTSLLPASHKGDVRVHG